VDRHVLTAQYHPGGSLERHEHFVAFVGREGAGGAGERRRQRDDGYGSIETAHPVQSVSLGSEHTIRRVLRPDSDSERAATLQIEILRDHGLGSALRWG